MDFWTRTTLSVVVVNIYHCNSDSCEHRQLSQQFSLIITNVLAVLLNMYQCFTGFFEYVSQKLCLLSENSNKRRIESCDLDLFCKCSYKRSKIFFVRLEDPASDYLCLFGRLSEFLDVIVLLWLYHYPAHGQITVQG